MQCPCGSGKTLANCCQPYIEGRQAAPTAEALMRSRYTAFAVAHIDYLLKSHHNTTRPVKDRNEILQWTKSVQWMGLTILSKSEGQATQNTGMVEFRAVFIENGQLQHIHEKSLFRKEKGMWYYVSGEHY